CSDDSSGSAGWMWISASEPVASAVSHMARIPVCVCALFVDRIGALSDSDMADIVRWLVA
ncbi:hypothetical protein, partial [Burkholderia ubonensis]|uniref:hypothetical protein n=1 Tax=Burkholderia ubonensis TaxID=101571 RepID=UPI001E5B7F19